MTYTHSCVMEKQVMTFKHFKYVQTVKISDVVNSLEVPEGPCVTLKASYT